MSNIWNTILKKQDHEFEARNKTQPVEDVCGISINEFKKRKIGIEIYSEVLNENVWLCSDQEMVDQILEDDRTATAYTVDEIMNLIKLKPDPEELRRIHDAKEVFTGSKLTDCNLNGENHDK